MTKLDEADGIISHRAADVNSPYLPIAPGLAGWDGLGETDPSGMTRRCPAVTDAGKTSALAAAIASGRMP
jgi:hypothetical protein